MHEILSRNVQQPPCIIRVKSNNFENPDSGNCHTTDRQSLVNSIHMHEVLQAMPVNRLNTKASKAVSSEIQDDGSRHLENRYSLLFPN
jgi:hypothetical protein